MAWHLAPTSRLYFFLKVGQYSHQPCVSRLEWRQSPEEVKPPVLSRVYAGLPDCPPTVLGSREMLRPCSSAGHDSADIIGNGDPLRMDAPVGCVATAATKKLAHAGDEPCLGGQERSSPSIHQTGGNISSTPSVGLLLEATSKLRAGGQLLQESGCVPPPKPQVHPHSWRVDRPRPLSMSFFTGRTDCPCRARCTVSVSTPRKKHVPNKMRGMHHIKPVSAEPACHSARVPKTRTSSEPPGHPGTPEGFSPVNGGGSGG